MNSRNESEIQVMQAHHTRDMVILPPLICTVLSFAIFSVQKMNLNRFSACLLVGIYFSYIHYNFKTFGNDQD